MRITVPRIILAVSVLVTGAAWVNALWLQTGKHPAPLFAAPPQVSGVAPASYEPVRENAPRERLARPEERQAQLRELQERLRRLGFYDGPLDGIDGPQTHMAVGFYQNAHGLNRVGMSYREILEHVRGTEQQATAIPPERPGS